MTPDASEVESLVARDGVFGFRNSVGNRKACCECAVRPLNRELKGARLGSPASAASIPTSVPTSSSPPGTRSGPHEVNPIADWSTQELTAYIAENNIPVIRCMRAASPPSAARLPARCSPASIRAPAAGGGRTRRRRSAGCT